MSERTPRRQTFAIAAATDSGLSSDKSHCENWKAAAGQSSLFSASAGGVGVQRLNYSHQLESDIR